MNRFGLRLFSLTLAASLLLAPVTVAQTPGLTDHPAWESDSSPGTPESSADEPATIAERLFIALLDRFPSDLEHEQAAQQIDAGQMETLMGTLLGSNEYRRLRSTKTPNTLLDQYFEGLLDRSPGQTAYRQYGTELSRGNDAGVLRALLASREFDETIAGQSLEAGPLEMDCMKAVEQRVTADLKRTTTLRFLTVATTKQSFIEKETRGTAKLPDGRGLEFVCSSERLTDSIIDVAYQITEEEERTARIVRCESLDQRRLECSADTRGGVTLVRQLGRVSCRQNVNWGYTERAIWVDRGCRADFRTMEVAAQRALEWDAEGSGFLDQSGSPAVWFSGARLRCDSDGSAGLAFSGRNTVTLSGTCYQLDEDRFELNLSGASGDWFTEGGGSVIIADGSLGRVDVAGRSRFGQPFTITFRSASAPVAGVLTRNGTGLLDVADGRRVSATAVRIEEEGNGRVTLYFEGQARFSFSGSWFPTWSGDHEVTVDGGLNDSTTRGAGTIRWSQEGLLSIDLVGTATSVGGSFRLTFEGQAGED